ncbi:MAG: hypothetical protein H8D39_05555, partial [Candidatus Atribacteria bacterium]|nr:hypothetical protein [Candidatus Atribacteria bacterium]
MDRAQAEKIYNSGKEAVISKLVELSSKDKKVVGYEKRQVFDIPKPKLEV